MGDYRLPMSEYTREMEQFSVFVGTVASVDWERHVCSVEDLRSKYVYREVGLIPCSHSSYESTDIRMPEEGALCLCAPVAHFGGHSQVAILTWVVSQTKQAVDSIARKDFDTIPGLNERKRGNYRKAWAGDQASSFVGGYSERTGSGWDRSSGGFDREDVDADRRTWTTLTSRHVDYSDAGLGFEGPAVRQDATTVNPASGVVPTTMPDGSREYTVFLQPGARLSDRYLKGKQDILPFTERVSRVQEFALDYPLPPEVMQTDLLDYVLGTTQDPWKRTTLSSQGPFQVDSATYFASQAFDHPTDTSKQPVGPTLGEGATPARKGFILERAEGTLIGWNRFDQGTYGLALKPVLSALTTNQDTNGGGRFGADFQSGYNPVKDSTDHDEARLAASCYSVRFPSEYNTTRWDVTKEGMLTFEVGSTIPRENTNFPANPAPNGIYEHPHGAGRSVEGHMVGSLKLVVGKNRDEEDSIDLQALGQSVLRLGCDDATLPDSGRKVLTQNRQNSDAVQRRALQYWDASHRKLKGIGDAGTLENKLMAEAISLRMATDGGVVARLGARRDSESPVVMRKHLMNGYSDGPGKNFSPTEKNSHSPGRPVYPSPGDKTYRFHDLTVAGQPTGRGFSPYNSWLGNPVSPGMDLHGKSLDLHAVRDVLLRIGKNPASWQSLMLDLDGGVVLAAGKDQQGRSLTGALDGGVEMTIGQSSAKKGLRLEITGDVDMMVYGNYHLNVTGDIIMEATNFRKITKIADIKTAQTIHEVALSLHTTEAPDIQNNGISYPYQVSPDPGIDPAI